jgi:hypothetical protein
VARLGDLLDEAVVKRLQLLLDFVGFVRVERTRRRIHLRVLADARAVDVRTQLFVGAARDELPAEDAN